MQLKKNKLFKISILILTLSLFLTFIPNIFAASHIRAVNHPDVESVSQGTITDSQYSFSLKNTENTEFKFWGPIDKVLYAHSGDYTYRWIFPQDDNLSGKIGYWIMNAGVYQGQPVDVKCTCLWEPLNLYGKQIYPAIGAATIGEKIGFSFTTRSYELKFELFSNGKPINANMSFCFGDVDYYQYFGIKDSPSIKKVQCRDDCILYYKKEAGYHWIYSGEGGDDDTPNLSARFEMENVHDFNIFFGHEYDIYSSPIETLIPHESYLADYMYNRTFELEDIFNSYSNGSTVPYIGEGWGYFTGDKYGPYTTPTPLKQVSDTDEKNVSKTISTDNEEITYNIYQRVPMEDSRYYYKSFVLEDTLPSGLDIISYKIKDENNKNVSSKFSFKVEGSKITATAKNPKTASFYDDTLNFEIKARINSSKLTKNKENLYNIKNQSIVRTIRSRTEENKSNEVTTLYYEKDIPIKKIWKDYNNEYNTRPESITLQLLRNNAPYKEITLNNTQALDSNTWTTSLTLPKFDENGSEYNYSIKEKELNIRDGIVYKPTVEGTSVTNTLSKAIVLTITKKWIDEDNKYLTRPDTLNIDLYGNDQVFRVVPLTDSNKTDNSTWKKQELVPQFDAEGKEINYTIVEDTKNPNIRYFYQPPVYDQNNLTVTNCAVWETLDANSVPNYNITISKEIVNNKNNKAETSDYENIRIKSAGHQFPIRLKELKKTLSKGETSMIESYNGYSGKEYFGYLSKENELIFKNIPAGKYELTEIPVQYFKFLKFIKLDSTSGATLSFENGKYFITISGITYKDENIKINTINQINNFRPYDKVHFKNNLFKS